MDTTKIYRLVHDLKHNVEYSIDGLVSCSRSFIEGLANLIESMNDRLVELEQLNRFGNVDDAECTLINITNEVENE